jgi:ABC-type multidrug transport system fused ATPase/permease subunit
VKEATVEATKPPAALLKQQTEKLLFEQHEKTHCIYDFYKHMTRFPSDPSGSMNPPRLSREDYMKLIDTFNKDNFMGNMVIPFAAIAGLAVILLLLVFFIIVIGLYDLIFGQSWLVFIIFIVVIILIFVGASVGIFIALKPKLQVTKDKVQKITNTVNESLEKKNAWLYVRGESAKNVELIFVEPYDSEPDFSEPSEMVMKGPVKRNPEPNVHQVLRGSLS